jgi:uncharacterized protein YkwD
LAAALLAASVSEAVAGGSGAAPPASASGGATATCGIAQFAERALEEINERRARGATCGIKGAFPPAPALSWDARLAAAAARHSRDMVSARMFSHTGSDGSESGQRITQAGYAWRAYGENISAGQTTLAAVIDGWMASPEHCANLMSPRFTQAGMTCERAPASHEFPTYWTLNLAAPR